MHLYNRPNETKTNIVIYIQLHLQFTNTSWFKTVVSNSKLVILPLQNYVIMLK